MKPTMKTVAFVPVKLNNQRAPGKNTKAFYDGTPLVTFFLRQLKKVKGIDELYVFCSSREIVEYMPEGVEFLQRPEFLDTAQATPQDIITEFMKYVDADIYMVCHCTAPFVTPEHIQQCLEAVKSGQYDSAVTSEKIQRLLWTADYKPMNFSAENVPRTQDLAPIYNEVSAAYVFTKEAFLTYHRRIAAKPKFVEVSGVECVDIDYPDDFLIANAIYKEIISKNVSPKE